jgi:uncharacterized protein YllA (UPF0747 family)
VPEGSRFLTDTTFHHQDTHSETVLDNERLAATLEQLHRLLEEYAPAWYTEQLHDQSETALKPYHKS